MSLSDGFWLSRSVVGGLSCEHASTFEGFLEVTHHVERGFGIVITSSLKELAESFDGLTEFTELSGVGGEDLRHEERLGEELLHLRALATVNLSSSERSSIPRMAIISWRDL